ncbi:MAG: radical SAM protein [Ruminococcus sp.]|nr:radical SAM protein [Ruminococcus sp.]
MKHSNISIFVPHIGCPHLCSFCDQRTISGAQHAPTGDEVREICRKALSEVKEPENAEIAFFGGSFTAVPHDYMLELLCAAHEFVGEGKFRGIRCSTRPDCIDPEVLQLLKGFGVTAIELGAQSMDDDVLELNERGHTSADVENACVLIRAFGFELGLQMMIGLYGSTPEKEWASVERIAALAPDTVRIYPVVVLRNTRLGELLLSGEYKPFSFEKAVEIASAAMVMFEVSGIRVIKCGLHASEFVEQDMVGGFYHPAFRELCEALIYRHNIEFVLKSENVSGSAVIAVNDRCISKAAGQKRSNIAFFEECGVNIKLVGDKDIPKYECELRR